MRLLVERGVHVVAGVLHGSDTDVEVAERLDVEHVSVPAFSEIDEQTAAAWREPRRGRRRDRRVRPPDRSR